MQRAAGELHETARRGTAWRAAVALFVVAVALVLYGNREWLQQLAWLQTWGAGAGTALLVVAVAAVLLTCGLTASAFLVLTPLLFPPHLSALVTTAGFTLGAAGGYAVARYVGGRWAARHHGGRVHRFLTGHASFLALFSLRLAPASPHSLVNYAAGLAHLGFVRFILATAAAMALKSYVYALAVHSAVNAAGGNPDDAVGARTLLSLLGVALLALAGHFLSRKFFGFASAASDQT
ncbi:MAG TPA: VTT domain-containing protein [Pyrinomonadaceae bacterium]|nr:VTT domain-containing protein [Pyrinomonadaceae bacterium]